MVLAVEAVQWHYVDAEALSDRFALHLAADGHARITVRVYKKLSAQFLRFPHQLRVLNKPAVNQ